MYTLSRRMLVIAFVLSAVATALVAAPAGAHWENYCDTSTGKRAPTGPKIKWANNSGMFWTYPPRWNGTKYERATKAAIGNINKRIAGDWGMFEGNPGSGIQWGSSAYGSAVARGFTRTSWNYDCHLLLAEVRYNESRLSGFGVKRLKAIAVHEAGHSYGVGHWEGGCTSETMMVKTWKCLWRTHRTNTMQPHDERDVRNTY